MVHYDRTQDTTAQRGRSRTNGKKASQPVAPTTGNHLRGFFLCTKKSPGSLPGSTITPALRGATSAAGGRSPQICAFCRPSPAGMPCAFPGGSAPPRLSAVRGHPGCADEPRNAGSGLRPSHHPLTAEASAAPRPPRTPPRQTHHHCHQCQACPAACRSDADTLQPQRSRCRQESCQA